MRGEILTLTRPHEQTLEAEFVRACWDERAVREGLQADAAVLLVVFVLGLVLGVRIDLQRDVGREDGQGGLFVIFKLDPFVWRAVCRHERVERRAGGRVDGAVA